MADHSELFRSLHESIQKRPRPEDVAELILEARRSELERQEVLVLERAAKHSFKRHSVYYSSMSGDFARVVGADRMVQTAAKQYGLAPLSAVDCLDCEAVRAFMNRVGESVQMVLGQHDFKKDRLNREQRKAAGVTVRRRGYNRRVRTIRRAAVRIDAMLRNHEKYLASRVAKSGGAIFVSMDDLTADLDTACLVAYLSARLNLRSTFTNTSQERAFDEVADMLLKRALRGTPNYFAIAMVHPEREILQHLDDQQKGHLLGLWTGLLARLAALLKTLYWENQFDLGTMIVRRGNDSSSWNAAAGAWNKARTQWIQLTYALGLEQVLDTYCPGKVMRLMAGDVANWHERSGGGLDPNTMVWRDLPLPWQVFDEKETCGRERVEAACRRHGVKIDGWVTPPSDKRPVAFKPTPELVHGVAVSSPMLARQLRKSGWFSGKLKGQPMDIPEDLQITRDPTGAVISVDGTAQVL